jgi:hypothetical protein
MTAVLALLGVGVTGVVEEWMVLLIGVEDRDGMEIEQPVDEPVDEIDTFARERAFLSTKHTKQKLTLLNFFLNHPIHVLLLTSSTNLHCFFSLGSNIL